jgi:protein CpxP
MKTSLRQFITVLALGAAVLPVVSIAQEAPPAEKRGPGGPGGGGRGRMTPEQQVERLSEALTLTTEQKTKIAAIYKEQATAMAAIPQEERREKMMDMMKAAREKIRATLTPEQMKKFDEMPPMGGGRGGPGGPGGPGGKGGEKKQQ